MGIKGKIFLDEDIIDPFKLNKSTKNSGQTILRNLDKVQNESSEHILNFNNNKL